MLDEALAGWPGDAPYRLERTARLANGDSTNLGAVTMSLHTGTHIDAPYHFDEQGLTVEAISPEVYIGPAQVLDVRGRATIAVSDLATRTRPGVPRLLLRTDAWTDPTRFPESIPQLAADVPGFLHAQGISLLGVDLPSVDALDSKALPIHHALGRNGIFILESLALVAVPEAVYELSALPLRICGADACPVRALLRIIE
jgi:arylformamidase